MIRRDSSFFKAGQNTKDHFEQTMEEEAFVALERNDGEKALGIFKKLAALGSGVACYCIGDIYLRGQGGIKFNPNEARKWYETAFASSVERLSQYAAIKLGYIYEAGYDDANHYGAAVDNEKAFYYYRRAEGSDIAIGLLRLGIMYEMGKGAPQDLNKAMTLYRQAASRHVIALKNLGSLKVRGGHIISGYILWGWAILEAFFLMIFKRNSPRIAML